MAFLPLRQRANTALTGKRSQHYPYLVPASRPNVPSALVQIDTVGVRWFDRTDVSVIEYVLEGRGTTNPPTRVPSATPASTERMVEWTNFTDINGQGRNYGMHECPDGSYIAILAGDTDLINGIYRCADPVSSPGVWTATRLYALGNNGGTPARSVRLLGNNCIQNITLGDGSDAVIISDYNVGPDTWAAVHISTDYVNWFPLWIAAPYTLNGGALADRVRHFHACYQNPVNGNLVTASGDNDLASSLVQGPPPANAAAVASRTHGWANIDDTQPGLISEPGFAVLAGEQRYRCIDLSLIDGFVVTNPDSAASGGLGFWAYSPDFSTEELRFLPKRQTPGDPEYDSKILGCGTLRMPNGDWIFAEYIQSGYTGGRFVFWGTRDGRAFYQLADVELEATPGILQAECCFNANGQGWLCGSYGQGLIGASNLNFIVESAGRYAGPLRLEP